MNFYTYAHYTPSGKVFYIGKGVNDRAYSFSDRSHAWKCAIKDNEGVNIRILAYWDTEQEAFEHEKVLISCFIDMEHPLVNKTKGGKGAYGYKQSEQTKQIKSLKLTGYKHSLITCPKCNKTGGETSMKRWHFDKCTGVRPFKARVSIDGKRVCLGNFETKDLATQAEIKAYKDANKPFPFEFVKRKGIPQWLQ
jgi:hypothetical protein